MQRRFPLLGLASCLLFAVAAAAFVHLWLRLGTLPVTRGWHTVGTFTDFLEAWTRRFWTTTLSGCFAGAFGMWRRAGSRRLATTGFSLNLLALVVLFVLTRTGRN